MNRRTLIIGIAITLLTLQGCGNNAEQAAQPTDPNTAHTATSSNRVAIPPAVRSNLGITLATVERRQIQDTLRVPGRFEYMPTAKREYRTMLAGRVEILVDQFDHVEQGTPLYRIDSPTWREIQQTLADKATNVSRLETKMTTFGPLLKAHVRHEESINENISVWQARVEKLEALREAGGGSMSEFATARSALASAHSEFAKALEKDAELNATRVETEAALAAARATLDLAIESASSMLNITWGPLDCPNPDWWKEIKAIEIHATQHGVVESLGLTNGAWADERTNVVTIVQTDRLRFHASGLQSDLGILRDGLSATIVPPTPTASDRSVRLQNTMHGTLSLGLSGDANERTIDLYVSPTELASWARSGIAAQLEIVIDSTRAPELAIPLAAVQRDGLTPVIFRRNPNNPDEAIRMEADLGLDDGRWVAILSGLADGDEVVLDGGFQLMLATSGSIQQGGHFHSDGTFHEGEH
jgi:multidrug efflux pump subunit AcrA (membrane-fusion protein)